jgi:hypothetical protein
MSEGTVDLAPNQKLRLARSTAANVFIDPFYDWRFPRPGLATSSDKEADERVKPTGAANRLQHWATYQQIATAMKSNNVYRVTLLTCNVGNAPNFIKKLALDWNTLVRAYTRKVWFVGVNPAKVCLDGDENGGPTLNADSATQLPQVDFITVGPPLSQKP